MRAPKLIVIGHAGHGKDTFCEMMGLNYESSSLAAVKLFLFDQMREQHGYNTPEELYANRGKHRTEMHERIKAFNTPRKHRLAEIILETNDVYCGMRDREELQACRFHGVADLVVWVSDSFRKPPESAGSINVTTDDADVLVLNNGTLEDLRQKAAGLRRVLYKT